MIARISAKTLGGNLGSSAMATVLDKNAARSAAANFIALSRRYSGQAR
jgi:hypothetical protein